jgi:hypothetical protein
MLMSGLMEEEAGRKVRGMYVVQEVNAVLGL